ncbi:GNAT family N-acetyltransferase [Mammaliicoccus vitulinus]|uniref:GNAT family N-acetyltransferase n=1 Tax=Mammaliicoccus vitulinus TaxID=71237 RepID=A0ABX7HFP9_9STAP|nr:GNAT family N-acetyltransferase [Mammaliicoccus vitulinus]PNZ35451.1 spermidine acetyltransferase [Mammaliicoccus vitulinus]QRO85445.1 GNAT family N-acetyltransferase [Mammaliicoccus vitulinus]QTN10379.1 GNAT family N-acetyltransferase [Mammaliicoccus vitulinus]QTN12636.1 GNAT family N-acetyltransferase [Mammaliicoccus vitulinus]
MKLRALEITDLPFVHELNNEYSIMSYWFEEPYESLTELQYLFDKHLLDESERRFIVEDEDSIVGIVELVEINYIHRNCEIQIIIKPEFSSKGYAKFAFEKATSYAFDILNMHKLYLYVDTDNEKAIHIYKSQGFKIEGLLIEQFYTNGKYKDAYIMALLKSEYIL